MTRIGLSDHKLLRFYERARNWVAQSQYSGEIVWQASLAPKRFSESDFLREYAWVVLNSGFREATVRRHFGYISLCYCDWESAQSIAAARDACINSAASAFCNRRKLNAIADTALIISRQGFESFKHSLCIDFFERAQALPFIGPTTVFHLAKNLGADLAKPDRHLVRVAKKFGYSSVQAMCATIAAHTGEKISVADIVIWRYQEQMGGFLNKPE